MEKALRQHKYDLDRLHQYKTFGYIIEKYIYIPCICKGFDSHLEVSSLLSLFFPQSHQELLHLVFQSTTSRSKVNNSPHNYICTFSFVLYNKQYLYIYITSFISRQYIFCHKVYKKNNTLPVNLYFYKNIK